MNPTTAKQRANRRAEYQRQAIERAYPLGRSIKCGDYRLHANDRGGNGCKNDGSNCICECHDVPVESSHSGAESHPTPG